MLGAPLRALGPTVVRSVRTLVAVADQPQLPLLLLILVAAFLAVQDWIDRRDPKLAMAALSRRESELSFPDLFGRQG